MLEAPKNTNEKEPCANLPLFTKKDYNLKNIWGLIGKEFANKIDTCYDTYVAYVAYDEIV